jgi:hypothetical protein
MNDDTQMCFPDIIRYAFLEHWAEDDIWLRFSDPLSHDFIRQAQGDRNCMTFVLQLDMKTLREAVVY